MAWNPQRPLVQSKSFGITNFDQLPAGQNAIVAMMSYTAYDIEDALILNKASLERGYQRATVYRKLQTMLKVNSAGERDTLFPARVNPATGEVYPHEAKLDLDGMIQVGQTVERGDIVVNKYVPVGTQQSTELTVQTHASASTRLGHDRPETVKFQEVNACHIDKVMISQFEREQLIKVRTSQTRIPEIGECLTVSKVFKILRRKYGQSSESESRNAQSCNNSPSTFLENLRDYQNNTSTNFSPV